LVKETGLPQNVAIELKFAAHLPGEEIGHLPASGDCVCPACGGALRRLAEDADETLGIEPIVFKVARHIRPKFSCRAGEKIVQAPAPDKAIARGISA
jgi:transposase